MLGKRYIEAKQRPTRVNAFTRGRVGGCVCGGGGGGGRDASPHGGGFRVCPWRGDDLNFVSGRRAVIQFTAADIVVIVIVVVVVSKF